MKECKHCHMVLSGDHYCAVAGRTIERSSEGDFIVSAVIGFAADSAILGGLLGGSLLGGLIGDFSDGDLMD